jgi:hypothetical protein
MGELAARLSTIKTLGTKTLWSPGAPRTGRCRRAPGSGLPGACRRCSRERAGAPCSRVSPERSRPPWRRTTAPLAALPRARRRRPRGEAAIIQSRRTVLNGIPGQRQFSGSRRFARLGGWRFQPAKSRRPRGRARRARPDGAAAVQGTVPSNHGGAVRHGRERDDTNRRFQPRPSPGLAAGQPPPISRPPCSIPRGTDLRPRQAGEAGQFRGATQPRAVSEHPGSPRRRTGTTSEARDPGMPRLHATRKNHRSRPERARAAESSTDRCRVRRSSA